MPLINATKLAHFSGHKDAVYSLCTGLNEAEFYSGGADGFVIAWNTGSANGNLLVKVNRPVYSLCLDHHTKLLYCGTASGNLHVIDLENGREIRNIEAHTKGIFDIKILGDALLTCGGDGVINAWSLSGLDLINQVSASQKSARCIAVDHAQNFVAVGFSDHKLRIYAWPGFELTKEIEAHNNSIFTTCFSPDDMEILSGGRDALLRSWLINEEYKMGSDIPAHTLHINHISFCADASVFSTVSMDKTVKIWDAKTKQLLKVIDKQKHDGHTSSVNKSLWLDHTRLVTCSDDRSVMMWEIAGQQ